MKNLLSILSFFISFACFGQMKNDTTVVCFPYKVAKQILLDLNSCDSIKETCKLTEFELKKTQEKVVLKDSIINTMLIKEDNYKTIIEKEKEKYGILEKQNNQLREDIRKNKTKNTFIQVIGGVIIGVLTYVSIAK